MAEQKAELAIDIETYSDVDLKTSGVYKYVESPNFKILLFAYSFGIEPVRVVDLASGEKIPDHVVKVLFEDEFYKTAFNANFERVCLAKHFGREMPAHRWICTAVKASMLGFPLSLDGVAKALNLPDGKDTAGKALIRFFCVPCKPTAKNGMRTRNLPQHDPEKWVAFIGYAKKDVEVEKEIKVIIAWFHPTPDERDMWLLDQRINDTGIRIDRTLVKRAIQMDIENREILTKKAVELTGLNNPNSVAQLKTWLSKEIGEDIPKLRKGDIPGLLENSDCELVTEVLQIRQEMAKTSIKKYLAMARGVCSDGRLHGIHQYYGANRTGRWAGRLVQPQNLRRMTENFLKEVFTIRKAVRHGDFELMNLVFDDLSDLLSQLIRTAFVASKGCNLKVADFSAIEARVIAWLAGEKWRLDVFNTHGKIYEASAAQMFKVPIKSISYKDAQGNTVKGPNYELRQKGKIAELALGYQGGPNALITMGALTMGVAEDELPKLVKMWRNANKQIVNYWYKVDEAAVKAVSDRVRVKIGHDIEFFVEHDTLFIQLPSGRLLSYVSPKIKSNRFGNEALHYMGIDQTKNRWCLQETYGGKLVENIVQAVARDCLADAMLRLDKAGYRIVMHVHDEVIMEQPDGEGSVDEVNEIMGTPISWAPGLPLNADGYQTQFYKKD